MPQQTKHSRQRTPFFAPYIVRTKLERNDHSQQPSTFNILPRLLRPANPAAALFSKKFPFVTQVTGFVDPYIVRATLENEKMLTNYQIMKNRPTPRRLVPSASSSSIPCSFRTPHSALRTTLGCPSVVQQLPRPNQPHHSITPFPLAPRHRHIFEVGAEVGW